MPFTYTAFLGGAGNNYGIISTSGGSTHTKGAYVDVIASISGDHSLIWTQPMGNANGQKALYDLATGAAAAEVDVLANLQIANSDEARAVALNSLGPFNVDVANTTRLSVRSQNTTATTNTRVGFMAANRVLGSFANPTTYGSVTGTTRGTPVDPGATINTKGAYTEITASTSAAHGHLIISINTASNLAPAAAFWRHDIATGAAASEVNIVGDIVGGDGTNGFWESYGPGMANFEVTVAVSTRLTIRSQSTTNDATDRLLDHILIGMDAPPATFSGEASHVF